MLVLFVVCFSWLCVRQVFLWGFSCICQPNVVAQLCLVGSGAGFGSNVCFEVVYVCKGHRAVWALYISDGGFPVHAGGV